MADALVILQEGDVLFGARLPFRSVEKNDVAALKRRLECRGLTCAKSEKQPALVRRVKEVKTTGLDLFVYDPDKVTTLRILQDHIKSLPSVGSPDVEKWCDNLDLLPDKYGYRTLVEYLVERRITLLDLSSASLTVPMPTADKPLVKGFNFFASGHVGEILVNR